MMDNVCNLVGQVALTILSLFFAYKYGRKTKENEQIKKEADAAAQADIMRRRLDDPDIVDELHQEFRR